MDVVMDGWAGQQTLTWLEFVLWQDEGSKSNAQMRLGV
jgi:hypothetical protein